jgi:hypothetical protein
MIRPAAGRAVALSRHERARSAQRSCTRGWSASAAQCDVLAHPDQRHGHAARSVLNVLDRYEPGGLVGTYTEAQGPTHQPRPYVTPAAGAVERVRMSAIRDWAVSTRFYDARRKRSNASRARRETVVPSRLARRSASARRSSGSLNVTRGDRPRPDSEGRPTARYTRSTTASA